MSRVVRTNGSKYEAFAQMAHELADEELRAFDAIASDLNAGRDEDALVKMRVFFLHRKAPHRERTDYESENNKAAAAGKTRA